MYLISYTCSVHTEHSQWIATLLLASLAFSIVPVSGGHDNTNPYSEHVCATILKHH